MTSEKWKRENFIFPNGNRRLSPGFEQKSSARFEHADYVNLGLAGVLACVLGGCSRSSTSR
jgi:hypothetical protein